MIRLRAPQDDLLCSLTLTSPAGSVRRDRFSLFSHIFMLHHDIVTLCICEINGSGGFLLHNITYHHQGMEQVDTVQCMMVRSHPYKHHIDDN